MGRYEKLALRKFQDMDRELLQKWLYAEHVAKWYAHPADWLDEIDQRHGAYAFLHHFIAECGGVPVGFCQYYEYSRGGEDWHGDIDADGAYSIDYLIGETAYVGKGLGKALIIALVDKISRHADAKTVIVQPDPKNSASRGALLSAGFTFDEGNQLYQLRLSPLGAPRAGGEYA